MPVYDRAVLGREAAALGFIRDTYEKVVRLADVLAFINSDPLLKDALALKGGTAINLTVFDLPRLSVDIDLDYTRNNPREEMMADREQVDTVIARQNRVASQLAEITERLDAFKAGCVDARLRVRAYLALAANCHKLYTTCDESKKRQINQAFFSRFTLTEDHHIDAQHTGQLHPAATSQEGPAPSDLDRSEFRVSPFWWSIGDSTQISLKSVVLAFPPVRLRTAHYSAVHWTVSLTFAPSRVRIRSAEFQKMTTRK